MWEHCCLNKEIGGGVEEWANFCCRTGHSLCQWSSLQYLHGEGGETCDFLGERLAAKMRKYSFTMGVEMVSLMGKSMVYCWRKASVLLRRDGEEGSFVLA